MTRGRLGLFSLALATASASSVFSTTTSVAGASEVELCFGQVPTIVGTPGSVYVTPRIEGTEGVDVVVTNGAYGADLLGGNDLLCITGEPDSVSAEDPPGYFTGDGNDRVDSTARTGAPESLIPAVIFLGEGADELVGGPLSDHVIAADDGSAADPDTDLINTGDGNDEVTSGGADVVDLGPGSNELSLNRPAPGAVFKGGGADRLLIEVAHLGEHSWEVNNGAGRVIRDSAQVGGFTGFSHFAARARGTFLFIGSDDRETFGMFTHREWQPRKGSVKLRMNAGNDHVHFYGRAPGAQFDGGDGTDKLFYSNPYGPAHRHIIFNLTSGLLKDIWARGETTRRAVHFEKASVSNGQGFTAGPTTIKGTSEANLLQVWGPGPATIYAKAGDDELLGGSGDSVLVGGNGHDIAHGEWGADTCKAEVRLSCES